jgi:hypothetical protein
MRNGGQVGADRLTDSIVDRTGMEHRYKEMGVEEPRLVAELINLSKEFGGVAGDHSRAGSFGTVAQSRVAQFFACGAE